jgi:hypothetical protein
MSPESFWSCCLHSLTSPVSDKRSCGELGQQIYAFELGILYAYWREKSGSLLAPIVGQRGRRGGVRFDVFDEMGLAMTGERGPADGELASNSAN